MNGEVGENMTSEVKDYRFKVACVLILFIIFVMLITIFLINFDLTLGAMNI